jgi:hypothetical protein
VTVGLVVTLVVTLADLPAAGLVRSLLRQDCRFGRIASALDGRSGHLVGI